jgi:hypothetical protein
MVADDGGKMKTVEDIFVIVMQIIVVVIIAVACVPVMLVRKLRGVKE